MNVERKIGSSTKKSNNDLLKPLLDIQTLDYYCRYVISSNKNVKASGLNLVKELFSRVDPSLYNDPERIKRIEFINRGLEARLGKKLVEKPLIIRYINGGLTDNFLLDVSQFDELSNETLAYLTEQAAELSKSYFVEEKYDQIIKLSTDLKNLNYNHRAEVVDQIQSLTSELNMKFNKMDDAISNDHMFTLIPGEFENCIMDTYARETSPSRVLKTGMVAFDTMLNGGFQSSRVYMLLALAAGGKSFTMLDLAMQIKKYNKGFKPHDPTKIPTIVFLTMENSQDENMSRMVGMMTSGKTFSDFTVNESFNVFRSNGLNYDPKTDPIDIVMIYKANLSVNTDYLYTIVDKMRELDREVICIFQDHIKRIRPVNKRNDIRLDLGEIVNEFKAFANEMDIPVITDSHLNRGASQILDDAENDNKQDLIRSLGSSNVSESYLMIDNCDLVAIINKEYDSSNTQYMGFKCVKTRTKCDLDVFYQPYEVDNPIKLFEDALDPVPAFKRSLKPEDSCCITDQTVSKFGNISKEVSNKRDDDSSMFTDNDGLSQIINSSKCECFDGSNIQYGIYGEGASCVDPYYRKSPWERELMLLYKNNPNQYKIAFNYVDENDNIVANSISSN